MRAGIRKDILIQSSAGKECQEILLEADQSYGREVLPGSRGRGRRELVPISASPIWEFLPGGNRRRGRRELVVISPVRYGSYGRSYLVVVKGRRELVPISTSPISLPCGSRRKGGS